MKKKILFAAAEVLPFAATGGLGEVAGSLPGALYHTGKYDIRVVLPLYGEIEQCWREQMQFIGSRQVELAWREQYCGLFRLEKDGVIYYFIDNEYYFRRNNGLYGYYDDGERYAFFCKAVLDCLPLMDFQPDILHAHDWQCALLPVYLTYRYHYPQVRTVFTIHNVEYQGKYGKEILGDVFALPPEALPTLEYDGCLNLMKGALECSDIISTVSPSYAQELHSAEYAHGLEAIIRRNSHKMRGILNGIHVDGYDPRKDQAIFQNYSEKDFSGKSVNKAELQKLAGLPCEPDVPLIAVVSRLASHKGVELICQAAEQMLQGQVQMIVLGKGDVRYEDWLRSLQSRYPGKIAAMITYSNDLSRKIYAGADLFLMPSKSEPCGLAQMIACRYGTVPVVRATGGLRDSIIDYAQQGFGFRFGAYTTEALLQALYRALEVYQDQDAWQALCKQAMEQDFSWTKSAQEYVELYDNLQPSS